MINRLCAAAVSICFLTLFSSAACFSQEIEYNGYSGTIGDATKIGMWLTFNDGQIEGSFFYVKDLEYLHLKGELDNSRRFEIRVYYANGEQTALFKGRFLSEDPDKHFTGKQLDKEVLAGQWVSHGKSLPFILRLRYATWREKGLGRYSFSASFTEDEEIELKIQAFREAVISGRREVVARYFRYPFATGPPKKKIKIRTQKEFVNNYDQIISPWLKEAIIESVPRNMFSNWRGICLGDKCSVWFDDELKVIWWDD